MLRFVGIDVEAERAELRNDGDAPVSLAGCRLRDVTGHHESRAFADDAVLPPGQALALWTAPGMRRVRPVDAARRTRAGRDGMREYSFCCLVHV